jgi:hypothetical protein
LYAFESFRIYDYFQLAGIITFQKRQGRLEAGSTCAKNTGTGGAATINRAPNAKGKGAKRKMNTVKFWLEPALRKGILVLRKYLKLQSHSRTSLFSVNLA